MSSLKTGLWIVTWLTAALWGATAALAQPAGDFYKGRQVTLIVPTGPGGGYALYGQFLSRYLGRHLPGEPTVIVQYMPGGGGNVAANYLYSVAPKDGSVVAELFSTLTVTQALQPTGAQFDATKFAWLGSVAPMINVVAVWSAAPALTYQAAEAKQDVMGATGKSADLYIYPKIMNAVLGTKFKIVLGYDSSGSILLAMQSGEVHGMAMGLESWYAMRPDWVADKKVVMLAQTGIKRDPLIPDVPTLLELAKSPEDKQIMTFLAAPAVLGRVVAAPPGIPADRLTVLRKAFDDTMKDPDFQNELSSRHMSVGATPGTEISGFISQIVATPAAVVERAKTLLEF